jgi:hypothetical protein
MARRKVMARVRGPVPVLVLVPVPAPVLGPSTNVGGARRARKGPVVGWHKTSRLLVAACLRHKSSMAYSGLEAARRRG